METGLEWDRLTARYDSARESAHAAVKPLFDLPPLMSQTGNGIHKLLATIRTTHAQIKLINLGRVTEAEVLYSYFILARLDARTIKEFNQSLATNDVPTLHVLTTWLERQAKNIDLTNEIRGQISKANDSKNGRDRRDQPPILAVQDQKVRFQSSSNQPRSRSPGPKGRSSSQQQKDTGNSSTASSHHTGERSKSPSGRTNQGRSQSPRHTAAPACAVCSSTLHRIHKCPEFTGYTVNARRDWVRSNTRCYNCMGTHSVKDCTSSHTCNLCKKKHHTLLHTGETLNHVNTIFASSSSRNQHDHRESSSGILPTAMVQIFHRHEREGFPARCLLDSGAEKCFITKAAVQRLGLPVYGDPQNFVVAGGTTTPSLGYTVLRIRHIFGLSTTLSILASVLPQITSSIPANSFDPSSWEHLTGLPLADPTFFKPGPIDILLGTAFMDMIMRGKKVEGPPGTPSAYLTEFGYVVQGRIGGECVFTISKPLSSIPKKPDMLISKPMFEMEQFWNIEELADRPHWTPREQACEDHFVKTTVRLPDGRYQIKWPFHQSPQLLGSSYKAALSRWLSMERKLINDPKLAAEYHGQLEDYLTQGHLEIIPQQELYKKPHFWIPHHAVFKESSTTTKMRIVFDASAKSSSGKSINSLLSVGPVIQAPLFDQLIRFRHKSIAMTADIAQMYRQISVDPAERDFARIIWRRHRKEPLQYYRHNRTPFGYTPASFMAVRCVHQTADDEAERFPIAAPVVKKSLYIDDFVHSEDGLDNAILLVNEIIQMLDCAKFELRKWSSSSAELLQHIPSHLHEPTRSLDLQNSETVGTLGMRWNPVTDQFNYTVALEPRTLHTKRRYFFFCQIFPKFSTRWGC